MHLPDDSPRSEAAEIRSRSGTSAEDAAYRTIPIRWCRIDRRHTLHHYPCHSGGQSDYFHRTDRRPPHLPLILFESFDHRHWIPRSAWDVCGNSCRENTRDSRRDVRKRRVHQDRRDGGGRGNATCDPEVVV